MKQHTTAPQLPTVAKPRACGALELMIAGAFDFKALGFKASGSTTATNLSSRRLGVRTT